MKKISAITTGVIVVGAAGWLGASWYTGKTLEAQYQRYVVDANQELQRLSPLFKLRIDPVSYDRGWFSSQARYSLSLEEDELASGDAKTKQISFDTHIEHGPFPKSALARGILVPRLAFAHTQLVQTPELKKLFDAFKGVTPLSSEDIISYSGTVYHASRIAPLQFTQDDVALDFSGMTMNGTFDVRKKAFTGAALIEKLAMRSTDDDGMNMLWSGISLDAASEMGKFGMAVGDTSLKMKRLEILMPEEETKLSIDDFSYKTKVSENTDTFSIVASYETGNIHYNDIPLGSGLAVVKFDQLDGLASKQLLETQQRIMGDLAKENADDLEQYKSVVEKSLRSLLARQPVISLQPISWKTDKGESSFNATVQFQMPETFEDIPLREAFIQAIKRIDAKLVVSKPMVEGMLTQYGMLHESLPAAEAAAEAQEQVRDAAGLAEMMNVGKNDGDNIVSTFVFADQVGSLNGTEMSAEELQEWLGIFEDDDDELAFEAEEDYDADEYASTAALELFTGFDLDNLVNLADDEGQSVTIDTEGGAPVLHLDPAQVGADALYINMMCAMGTDNCEDLVFVAEYKTDRPVPLRQINSWNQRYRWIRAYLNDEGVSVLEMDLNAEGGIGAENLRMLYNTYMSIASDFGQFVRE
ncbi:DUF945 family protein [Pusillimonas sp. CC-YST705]|uniref:DUF945 family protein n=1 Tax=Mesopusillimonas faecipullorum TaxID=2755040 RepID=A0ABS8C8R7_9BURK|nr:DUF945 family protein [Mesopusillimonas faecipullorum]MCB5362411.1 DUF945 family protein [Mesopusillimonas faecipullorum]